MTDREEVLQSVRAFEKTIGECCDMFPECFHFEVWQAATSAERERCAMVATDYRMKVEGTPLDPCEGWAIERTKKDIAAAIRD